MILFILLFALFFGLGIYSAVNPKSNKINCDVVVTTDTAIEDLQKIQTYNFWRDFDS